MKKMYLLLLIIISLVALSLYSTYAMFTADLNIGEFINLTASNLPTEGYTQEYETVGIDAYQSKTIDLNITNSTSNSLYYGVWYQMVDPSTINSNIKIGLTSASANPSSGQIASSETKTVSICIKNNTNSAIVINIGAGYSDTNSLNLPNDKNIISGTFDNIAPSLSLTKETYLDMPFDDTWTYSEGATVDSDGVLTYEGEMKKTYAQSPFIPVNGEYWYTVLDVYLTNALEDSTTGNIYWNVYFYDDDYNDTTSPRGVTHDGAAPNRSPLNTWNTTSHKYATNYYWAPNIKYVKLNFYTSNGYSSVPPIKIRNLKTYGQMKNSFYLINVKSSDNVGVTTTKCAKGSHSKEYFKEHGTVINNNKVTVTENGTYTVYVEDAVGNATIDTIEITNINIPSDYQKVEYISSTGTQYIDTGVSPSTYNGDYKIELKEKHSANASAMYIIGTTTTNTAESSRANIRIAVNGATCNAYANNSANTGNVLLSRPMLVDSVNTIKYNVSTTNTTRELEVNGSSTSSTTAFVSASTISLKLFGLTAGQYVGSIYEAKIYGGNNLVRDFVPVYRKSDGVAGLYDTVNNVFYTNQGDGEFGTGDNIPAVSS